MSPGLLLVGAALGLLTGLLAGRTRPHLWLSAVLTAAGAALGVALWVLRTGATWAWQRPWEIAGSGLRFQLDGLSAFFLCLVAFVGGAGALYAHGYWSDRAHPRSAPAGRLWWCVLLLSLGLVLVTTNGLHFLLGWEVFTLAAYFLITLDRRRREVRAAGWLYLGASHVGTLALFAFFAGLAAKTGGWALGPHPDRADLAPLYWLALFGFGLKAGAFPLHVWLPSAHANAPSHVSAILSGVTIKLGIYGLLRFGGWLPVPAAAAWTVVALGGASAVLGVAFALGQHDLKRLLAYHSVENIGIILLGVGFAFVAAQHGQPAWGRLALAGALLHVWNHGLFKSLLFFGAGSVLHATGTREMSRLGGLWRAMPWTAGLFALGAAAIAGLPPLNGFVSEWLVFLGLFEAALDHADFAWAAVPAAILLGLTGALALACFVKVCGVVFLGAPRSPEAIRAHESGPAMLAPMRLLAAACVAIGVVPILFWPALARALAAWSPAWAESAPPAPLFVLSGAHLLLAMVAGAGAWFLWRQAGRAAPRRAVTWDCGYAAPAARMQYTAGSFAATLVEWFAWILRPSVHEHRPEEPFPAHARHSSHTPETVLEHVIAPVGGVVLQAAGLARRLQHGRLQAYLLYLVVGAAGLLLLVWMGNSQ